MLSRGLLALPVALFASAVKAQGTFTNETTLGIVVFHNACDRTSNTTVPGADWRSGRQLTSVGANNCYNSGTYYRNRYLRPPSRRRIYGADGDYDANFVQALVAQEHLYIQSGTAFLQGMFPPTANTIDGDSELDPTGSAFVDTPLDGYQYAVLDTYTKDDPQSIWVRGDQQCLNRVLGRNAYYATPEFYQIFNSSLSWFQDLYATYLVGVFDKSAVNFASADAVWDYVSINRGFNVTLQNMSSSDFEQLRGYATTLMFNEYANLTTSSAENWETLDAENTGIGVRDIGARTMARKVLSMLAVNIDSTFSVNKINFMLGDVDTFLSFFAVSNLTQIAPELLTLPEFGASMVFELFTPSNGNFTQDNSFQTQTDDLFVRFGFRNGTTADMFYYPLFDVNGNTTMSWQTFSEKMNEISVAEISDWCTLCHSSASFCSQEVNLNITYINVTSPSDGAAAATISGKTMKPAVAGVIGAIVGLAVAGIVAAGVFCCCGVGLTMNRQQKRLSVFTGLGRSKPEKVGSEMELPLSPHATAMGTNQYDDLDGKFDTVSSGATAVQPPSPAHLKTHD